MKVMSMITLVVMPAGLGILAIADLLIPVFLGDKWLETIPLIQIMAIYGILMSITSNAGYIYVAIGKPKILSMLYGAYSTVLISMLIFLSMRYGALGAARALLAAALLITPIALGMVMYVLRISLKALIASMIRPAISSILMLFSILWIKDILPISVYSKLAVCILFGAIIYTVILFTLWQAAGKPQSGEMHMLNLLKNKLGD
jgi:O-antigen/teichoic acid export membrane protein